MVELCRDIRLSMASMLRGAADFGQGRGQAYASSEVGEDESVRSDKGEKGEGADQERCLEKEGRDQAKAEGQAE